MRAAEPSASRRLLTAPRLAALLILAAASPLGAQAPPGHGLAQKVPRTPTAATLKVPPGILTAYVTPAPRPTVPAVEGHPLEQAVRELRSADFRIEFAGDEPSAGFAPGSVARQEPAGGAPIPPGPRVVRIWRAVVPPPATAAAPTLTPTPVETATPVDTPTPVPTATPAGEAPSPTPAEAAGAKERPTRLPPAERPARPTPTPTLPPTSNFSWLVVAGLAALAAGAWLALRPPSTDGGKDGPSRAPDVEILPRSDLGTQEIASPRPTTSGLTFHAVPDPGEQSLAVNGPLVIEGKTL